MIQRRLLFAMLCAFALASTPNVAQAQLPTVSLSLNLRYHDPADPTEGGRWFLVAKTSAAAGNLGLASLDVYLANIDPTGIVFGNGGIAGFKYPAVSAATLGAEVVTPDGGPFAGLVGGVAHITYGQDNSPGASSPLVLGVGTGAGTPGNVPTDPLVNFAVWNDASLIASGTFPAGAFDSRPAFAAPGGLAATASVFTSGELGSPLAAATVTTRRRGDSVGALNLNTTPAGQPTNAGLLRGDTNRDFRVDGDDLNQILVNFGSSGKTWDTGDVTDGYTGHVEGRVNGDDMSEVLVNFNTNSLSNPPATQPVPEPAASLVAVLLAAGFATVFRRCVSCGNEGL